MTPENKTYTQTAWGTKLVFNFLEDNLEYSSKIANISSVSDIPYLSISTKKWEYTQRNTWFRNMGIIWIAIGFVFALPSFGGDPKSYLWCVLGAVMFIAYFVTKMTFTVIQTENERIMILKDDTHDEILNTIMDLRKSHIKSKYGEINVNNSHDAEKKKFELLLKEGVISKQELEAAHKQIDENKKNTSIPSPFV